MAERLAPHDMQTLIRSAAMAPLSPDTVRQVLDEHYHLLTERVQLETLLHRLTPAWAEVRAVLNELAKLANPADDG